MIDRRGEMWEVDLSGDARTFTRVLVVETLPPPSDAPGAVRFINHRCIIVEKDDDSEALKQQVRQMKFQMVLVEDMEMPWHAKRRPIADPFVHPIYRRLV